jgi:p-aminobenzoyl-glutamate transporter AbgT
VKPSDLIVQSGPPATVIAAGIYGLTLQEWASALAIVLLILQIGWFIYSNIIRPRRIAREELAAKALRRTVVEKVVAKREAE